MILKIQDENQCFKYLEKNLTKNINFIVFECSEFHCVFLLCTITRFIIISVICIFLIGCSREASLNTGLEGELANVSILVNKPPLKSDKFSLKYYWNYWADKLENVGTPIERTVEPVAYLEPNSFYALSIHLSAIKYPIKNVRGPEVNRTFRNFVEKYAREHRRLKVIPVTPVLLTDPRFFKTKSHVLPELIINLEKVREGLDRDGYFYEDSAISNVEKFISDLRDNPSPDYVFSEMTVPLSTTETFGSTAVTAIGLSFWHKGRPLDELSIPFCIRMKDGGPCPDKLDSTTTLGGSVLFDVAGNTTDTQPDAALHIIELGPKNVVGVFHRSDMSSDEEMGGYKVWDIIPAEGEEESESASMFLKDLSNLQERFGEINNPKGRVSLGLDLVNLIFPNSRKPKSKVAMEAFRDFVAQYKQDKPFSDENPKTIFVRMILKDKSMPGLFPLGLLNFEDNTSSFIGYHFRIEIPLPKQNYNSQNNCLTNWVPVIRTRNFDANRMGVLKEAFGEINKDGRLKVNSIGKESLRITHNYPPVPVYYKMADFNKWIRDEAEGDSAILVVLSHHNNESLFFDNKISIMSKHTIRKQFRNPSVAILSGCSTGKPGSSGVIRALNSHNFDSVIATNTGINGRLAGSFVNCFFKEIENSDSIYVGTAFSGAQRCLYNDVNYDYDSQLLSFTFAGNPSTKICGTK